MTSLKLISNVVSLATPVILWKKSTFRKNSSSKETMGVRFLLNLTYPLFAWPVVIVTVIRSYDLGDIPSSGKTLKMVRISNPTAGSIGEPGCCQIREPYRETQSMWQFDWSLQLVKEPVGVIESSKEGNIEMYLQNIWLNESSLGVKQLILREALSIEDVIREDSAWHSVSR